MTIRVQLAERARLENFEDFWLPFDPLLHFATHRCNSLQLRNLTNRKLWVVVFPQFGSVPKMERSRSRTAKDVFSVTCAGDEENINVYAFGRPLALPKDEGRLRRALRRKLQPTA